ncbi:MAG: DNA-binding response regulator [Proteobacteria bacterium]|nr:DNA-binding response regulator [Pseudomonadota bacterium]
MTWLADGATDLLASGPEVTELILRLQARLREAEPEAALAGTVALGPAVLDLDRSEWRLGSRIVHLTPLEVSLMALLGQNAGRLVSMTRMLTEGLGHPGGQGSPEAVRNHIRNLRLKLEPDPAHPQLLVNIPGRGYMLQEPKIYLT